MEAVFFRKVRTADPPFRGFPDQKELLLEAGRIRHPGAPAHKGLVDDRFGAPRQIPQDVAVDRHPPPP